MIFFSDFDGTLTLDGKLTREFFEILDVIERRGDELIIVSGRSLSWGHFFLTHFPLKYCIMEGGGVVVYRDENGLIQEKNFVSDEEIRRLEDFTKKLSTEHPDIPLSKDSFGRRTDRAMEYHEMTPAQLDLAVDLMTRENITFTKSNVHINFWCGVISKYLGVTKFIQEFRPEINEDQCFFFGDAPNDESMFELFHNSVGVSNINHCLDRLNHKPRIILEGDENIGAKGVLNFICSL